jgi:hypothetical protein
MLTGTKQYGMTFWGLLISGAVFVFFLLLFFRLLPPYIEHAKVKTSLENMARQPDAGEMEKVHIRAALERRFSIEDVNDVDLTKSLFVEKRAGGTVIRIAYERRVPLAYNVTALIVFDDTVQVNVR